MFWKIIGITTIGTLLCIGIFMFVNQNHVKGTNIEKQIQSSVRNIGYELNIHYLGKTDHLDPYLDNQDHDFVGSVLFQDIIQKQYQEYKKEEKFVEEWEPRGMGKGILWSAESPQAELGLLNCYKGLKEVYIHPTKGKYQNQMKECIEAIQIRKKDRQIGAIDPEGMEAYCNKVLNIFYDYQLNFNF